MPAFGTLVSGVIACASAMLLPVDALANVVSAGLFVAYSLINIGLLVGRYDGMNFASPFSGMGYSAVSVTQDMVTGDEVYAGIRGSPSSSDGPIFPVPSPVFNSGVNVATASGELLGSLVLEDGGHDVLRTRSREIVEAEAYL